MPHTPTLTGESRALSTAGALHAAALSQETLVRQSDERLVTLARAGSERAFAEITRRYQRPLRAYCSRLVGAERAQDAVQQALLQAFLSLRDHAPRQIALRPWLYRIAHNCSVDLLRIGGWDHEQLDLEYDGVAQPPALLEQKEELRGLIAGMRRLPDAQRRALTLRELEGRSYEEISARLGHTGSGVRQLIFRARSTLRKGACALLPFGVWRERLSGLAPAVDSHHVVGVASVPASSGGGLDTVGAAALAVVAVLGGVAGGVRAGGHQRHAPGSRAPHEHRPGPARIARVPVAVTPLAGAGARGPERRAARRRPLATSPAAMSVPSPQAAPPPATPQAPIDSPVQTTPAATGAADPAQGDGAGVVGQLAVPPAQGGPGAPADPPAESPGSGAGEPQEHTSTAPAPGSAPVAAEPSAPGSETEGPALRRHRPSRLMTRAPRRRVRRAAHAHGRRTHVKARRRARAVRPAARR